MTSIPTRADYNFPETDRAATRKKENKGHEGACMKIMINLSSLLLGKALQEQIAREAEGYQILAATDIQGCDGFCPDFIVTDCHTLRRNMPFPQQEAKIILIDYGLSEEEIASLLLSYKIDGVMATTTDLNLFKKALRSISQGQIWIDNRKIKALVQHAENAKEPNLDESLSKKEREIIILISQGLINREIASMLCISEQTVKTHISRIFRKLKVSRRSQLVPLAMKLRISSTAP
jgi:DNA-binding CsgD family transcriptional regulator